MTSVKGCTASIPDRYGYQILTRVNQDDRQYMILSIDHRDTHPANYRHALKTALLGDWRCEPCSLVG